jgi:hypothetical protein
LSTLWQFFALSATWIIWLIAENFTSTLATFVKLVLFVYNSSISWRRLFMWYVQICRSWTLCPMLHVSLDCPFTFIFHFSKIQQNVMIIKYEQWRPSVEPHFNWIVVSFLNMLGKFGCMHWKVALRKEISALSVLKVWFVLFILYTEYVALHSSCFALNLPQMCWWHTTKHNSIHISN